MLKHRNRLQWLRVWSTKFFKTNNTDYKKFIHEVLILLRAKFEFFSARKSQDYCNPSQVNPSTFEFFIHVFKSGIDVAPRDFLISSKKGLLIQNLLPGGWIHPSVVDLLHSDNDSWDDFSWLRSRNQKSKYCLIVSWFFYSSILFHFSLKTEKLVN